MSSTSFTEWPREKKEEFAKERMDKMKLLNEKIRRRHAEVEQDRIKAEAKNSSVTSCASVCQKKEKCVTDNVAVTETKVHEREWDRGKTEEDWNSSNPCGLQSRSNRKDYKDRKFDRRDDAWRPQSNVNRDNGRRYASDSASDKKSYGNNNYKYGESNYSPEASSNSRRSRGRSFRPSRPPPFRSSQKTRPFDSRNKSEYVETNVFRKHLYAASSSSPSVSDSEQEPEVNLAKTSEFVDSSVWDNVEITDVQHKQSRVEKWVKSIPNRWVDDKPNKEFHGKYESGNFHDKDRKHDHSFKNEWHNELHTRGKSNVGFRDQTQYRERESKFDGQKSGRGGYNARGNRYMTRESFKETAESDSIRRGNYRRKNFNERNRWPPGFTSGVQNDKYYGKDIKSDKRNSESYSYGKSRYKAHNERSGHPGFEDHNSHERSSKFKQDGSNKSVNVEESTSYEASWNNVSEPCDDGWTSIEQSNIGMWNEELTFLNKNKTGTHGDERYLEKSTPDMHSPRGNLNDCEAHNAIADPDDEWANIDQSDSGTWTNETAFFAKTRDEGDDSQHYEKLTLDASDAQNIAFDTEYENRFVDLADPNIEHDIAGEVDSSCVQDINNLTENFSAVSLNTAESLNFQEQIVEKEHELSSIQSDNKCIKTNLNESESEGLPLEENITFRSETSKDSDFVHANNETVYENKLTVQKDENGSPALSVELSSVSESHSLLATHVTTETAADVEHYENCSTSKTLSGHVEAKVTQKEDHSEESTEFSDPVPDKKPPSELCCDECTDFAGEVTEVLSKHHLCDEDIKDSACSAETNNVLTDADEDTEDISEIIHSEQTKSSCVMSVMESECNTENSQADSKLSSSHVSNVTKQNELLNSSVCSINQSCEKLQSPEYNTCALSQSDDGGWSTVSDENECSEDSTNCDDTPKK